MQYESTTYWARAQHFLVAHTFLLGIVATRLPVSAAELAWARIASLTVACAGGLLFALLWLKALDSGEYWISHVTDVVRRFEDAAFPPDVRLLRPFPRSPKYVSAKRLARHAARLFFALWLLSLAYLLFCGYLKAKGFTLV